jgi:DNA polymerase I
MILQSGKVNPLELVIRRHITREAGEYTNNSISAVVAKMVESMGIHLAAGESIEFIIVDQSGRRTPDKAKPLALYAFEDGYDITQYTELAVRAAETLLLPLGYDADRLKREFGLLREKRKPRRVSPEELAELPLFRIEI